MKLIAVILVFWRILPTAFAGSGAATINCDKGKFYLIGTVPAEEIQVDFKIENDGKEINLLSKATEMNLDEGRLKEINLNSKYYVQELENTSPGRPKFFQKFTSKRPNVEVSMVELPKSIRKSQSEERTEYFFDADIYVRTPEIFPNGKLLKGVRCRWTHVRP